MKIKILYEDKDMLVIDKPTGLSVHGDGKINKTGKKISKEKTISDWFVKKYPKAKNVGEDLGEGKNAIKKPGIVHRLDRDTSGVLLLAKTEKAYEFLKNQFVNREIKKTYDAFVLGFVKDDRGVINKPIGRSPKDFRRRLAGRGARGEMREAITGYKVLKRFKDKKGEKFTHLEVYPKTGRTHQIRVHMKYLNHPVTGDTLYNPDHPTPPGLLRLALHAREIEFKNLKGETLKIVSPLPKEWKKVVQ